MGLFATIFGSDSVIQAGIDGIDKMVYTDEEKSDKKALFLKLYVPFKLAQRYLAMTFCPPYMLCWVLTFIIEVVDIFIEKDLDTTTLYNLLQGDVSTMISLILGFYFGSGLIEGGIAAFKGKKG